MPLHSLLVRQLRRLQLEPPGAPSPEQFNELLERVSRAYTESDQDRYTLERSIEVSGTEMGELYAALAREHEAMVASRNRNQAIFEHSVVGQAVIDDAGKFSEVNRALAKMLACPPEALVGRALLDLSDESARTQFATPLRELLAGEKSELSGEQHWQTPSGTGLWVQLSLSLVQSSGSQPRFASLFVQNVTERKRLELELRHAQKLESVGRLAAGIAHEINTPVQFVGDNLPFLEEAMEASRALCLRFREMLERAIAAGSVPRSEVEQAERSLDNEYFDREVPRALEQTREGLQRVTTIVRAMKDFARSDGTDLTRADLNLALANTLTIARSELQRVAEVQPDFGEIPPVLCNLGDLNQVFLNLLVNAADAIEDAVGTSGRQGVIGVRTTFERETVVITISDTGTGIPEHVQAHIFEPFFTTKDVGRGTGQGLAMARSIVVDRHAGQLSFRTRVGEGTTFEIRLPVERARADAGEAVAGGAV